MLKVQQIPHNAPLQKLSGHWATSLFWHYIFQDHLQFSVHVGYFNTSCDWLTKGLHVDLLRHFAALSVLNNNIYKYNIIFVERLYKDKW